MPPFDDIRGLLLDQDVVWVGGGSTANLLAVWRVHGPDRIQRRPLFHQLIGDGVLPDGYATDNGAGLVYHGTRFVEAVTEVPGRAAYLVRREGDHAVEERIDARALPGAG
jgi:hypothetical protein